MTDRVAVQTVSPFQRLAQALAGIPPGRPPISLAVGEPQHAVPDFVGPVLARNIAEFGRYPSNAGTDEFRTAVAGWLDRRYRLDGAIDPASMIVALNGSREGLFLAGLGAKLWYPDKRQPVVLMPNPFYQAYRAGAMTADAERIAIACTGPDDAIPDYGALSTEILDRTIAAYVASPANPQGTVASSDDWKKLIALARKHRFVVLADECYSEIYRREPPAGVLEAAHETGDFSNVVAFHSLSKRSNLPGLRVGFAAGDRAFLHHWLGLRALAAPQVPVPLQAVAIAAYGDEAHVAANRALYNETYAAAYFSL
jgi:aspartate/methionine/tyrosine aminotransferase